jgi:hypothetical protein
MEKTFSKSVPDELYIDSFAQNKTATYTYDGPETFNVLVEKLSGGVTHVYQPGEDHGSYNSEQYEVMTVDANTAPDVAKYLRDTAIPERVFETEQLPGNKTYQKITNPTLRDYYAINYNFDNSAWNWKVITVVARTQLNDLADRYKKYVEDNISKIEGNSQLIALANTYLGQLEDFNTTGIGSIPSWKFIEISLVDVPQPPSQLVVAFNVLP